MSGERLCHGNDSICAQFGEAFQSARSSFPRWAIKPFAARQGIVYIFGFLLVEHNAYLKVFISRDTGIPRCVASTDVSSM
ncbi:aldehyde dehydrogenase family protein, partial [Salmonella enterica subsp. enterica serovar Infantis]